MCGKTYLSNPALYLHMKIKHQQGEGRAIGAPPGGRRGRGRPRVAGEYNSSGYLGNQRMDPTGEMFLRSETRAGGPCDPIHSFGDNVKLLFGNKLETYTAHPMFQWLSLFAFRQTPLGNKNGSLDTKSESIEEKEKLDEIYPVVRKGPGGITLTFHDVSNEI